MCLYICWFCCCCFYSVLIYCICIVENITIINDSKDTSALGSNIELDLSSLLDLLPREERHEEVKQVRVYCFVFSVLSALYFILFYFWFICINVTPLKNYLKI